LTRLGQGTFLDTFDARRRHPERGPRLVAGVACGSDPEAQPQHQPANTQQVQKIHGGGFDLVETAVAGQKMSRCLVQFREPHRAAPAIGGPHHVQPSAPGAHGTP
jgi:hypothetical protein